MLVQAEKHIEEEDKISVDMDIFSSLHDLPALHPPPHPSHVSFNIDITNNNINNSNNNNKFVPQPKIIRPRSAQSSDNISIASTNTTKAPSSVSSSSPSSSFSTKPKTSTLNTLKSKVGKKAKSPTPTFKNNQSDNNNNNNTNNVNISPPMNQPSSGNDREDDNNNNNNQLIHDDDSLSKYFIPTSINSGSNNDENAEPISPSRDEEMQEKENEHFIKEEDIPSQPPLPAPSHSSHSSSSSSSQSFGIASEFEIREFQRKMKDLDDRFNQVLLSSSIYPPPSIPSPPSFSPSPTVSSLSSDSSSSPFQLPQKISLSPQEIGSHHASPHPISPLTPFHSFPTQPSPLSQDQPPLQYHYSNNNPSFPIFHKPVPTFIPKPTPALPLRSYPPPPPSSSSHPDDYPVFTFIMESPPRKSHYEEDDIFAVSPLSSNSSPSPPSPPRSPYRSSSPLSNNSLSYSTDSLFMSV